MDGSTPSTAHRFGGKWTAEKLQVLRDYLGFYTVALQGQRFRLVYIDTFAGTGRCKIKLKGQEAIIDGSAAIALNTAPAFHRFHFIERKARHAAELRDLISSHRHGHLARLNVSSAADVLPAVLAEHDWRNTRGVLFLDPYGLQCTWAMLEAIAATKALDVFFLVSLSGLYRQAARDASAIDEGKAAALTRFLGTDQWRTALYTQEQGGLFDGPTVTRARGYTEILNFVTTRLRTAFPHVADPRTLGKVNGAPLYALYFAVSNPSPKAVQLARKVSREILSKLG